MENNNIQNLLLVIKLFIVYFISLFFKDVYLRKEQPICFSYTLRIFFYYIVIEKSGRTK